MPNGGTDNCMNCHHNRANQPSENTKAARRDTRISFCNLHQIPIRNRAWTYCTNIGKRNADPRLPVFSVGISKEGYDRIPWFGRTKPATERRVRSCTVCGQPSSNGIEISDRPLGSRVRFCSNEHYRRWHEEQRTLLGHEAMYDIGRNELQDALLEGDHQRIESTMQSESDLEHLDGFGWTALHISSYLGMDTVVRELLKRGAHANRMDKMGQFPIDLAGSEGHLSVVSILLPLTYSDDRARERALLDAATAGNLAVVESLISAGTDIECKDYRGRTPLLLAVWEGHFTTAVFLLDHGADVRVEDEYGNSPLKTVTEWSTRGMSELRVLIHEWLAKANEP
jgi:hypothetical protein